MRRVVCHGVVGGACVEVPWGCAGSRRSARHSGALRVGRSRPASSSGGFSARWGTAGASAAAAPPAYRETKWRGGGEGRAGQGPAAAPSCRGGEVEEPPTPLTPPVPRVGCRRFGVSGNSSGDAVLR